MIFTGVRHCKRRVRGKSVIMTFLYWLVENKKQLEFHVYDGVHYMKLTPKEFGRFVKGPS